MRVSVVYSAQPRELRQIELELPVGATVMDAVIQSGFLTSSSTQPVSQLSFGVWGQACLPGRPLHEHDRVELHRPLRVDPKVARRTRFERQGARAAGLFARKRPGSKAGY